MYIFYIILYIYWVDILGRYSLSLAFPQCSALFESCRPAARFARNDQDSRPRVWPGPSGFDPPVTLGWFDVPGKRLDMENPWFPVGKIIYTWIYKWWLFHIYLSLQEGTSIDGGKWRLTRQNLRWFAQQNALLSKIDPKYPLTNTNHPMCLAPMVVVIVWWALHMFGGILWRQRQWASVLSAINYNLHGHVLGIYIPRYHPGNEQRFCPIEEYSPRKNSYRGGLCCNVASARGVSVYPIASHFSSVSHE